MLRNVLLMILSATIVFALGVAYAADEAPAADSFTSTYIGERTTLYYTGDTVQKVKAETIVISE